jgi:hypothetical protein
MKLLGLAGVALVGGAVLSPACSDAPGCFGGDDGACVPPSPCQPLAFSCDDTSLELFVVTSASERPPGLAALAARGDVVLGNARMRAVIDAAASPHHLATSGGALLDLVAREPAADGAADGAGLSHDDLSQMLQSVGILPDDQARYHHLELVDQRPELVAVIARGRLDGRSDVHIVTRYEARPCEPGLRVRSEVYHGGRDPLAMLLADAFWWGGRKMTPFVPLPAQGFVYPDLDLLKLGEVIFEVPFMAAQGHGDEASAYGVVRCDDETAEAFQSTTISAVGRERTVVLPGDAIAYERFVAVGRGPGLGGAADGCYQARAMLHGEASAVASGRVTHDGGEPVGGDERLVSLLFYEPTDPPTPRSEVVPDADGRFRVHLPAHRSYRVSPRVLGRALAGEVAFELGAAERDIGAVVVPATGVVEVTVTDGALPVIADVVLTPADEARAADFRGSVHGQFDIEHCAPFLGPPHGGAPACNRTLVDAGGVARLAVPEGSFWVYASRGPFAAIDRALVEVRAGETTLVTLAVETIDGLLPDGWLAADFHVHGGASFDSGLPDRDRALSFVASAIDVLAATDHDVVASYAGAIADLGLGDRVVVMPGVETTGQVLFDLRADADFPQVIGHYNFWPLTPDALAPRNGAPDDERIEPGALFDRMAALYAGEGVAQLNHPFAENVFGRDEGYLTAVEYDPRVPIRDDGGVGSDLLRRPAGGRGNLDHDAQEVMNGASTQSFLNYRAGWFAFLDQGILRGGTANSDSHTLAVEVLGYPRTLVAGDHALATFDADAFNRDVKKGRMVGTNGPVLSACVDGPDGCRGPSLDAFAPAAGAALQLEVRAAPWIPVEEIRVIANGTTVAIIDGLASAADPFAREALLAYQGAVPLDELLAGIAGDAWIVVEAGYPLWPAADLDDDGVVETTDNNGDGAIDERDHDGLDEGDRYLEPPPPLQDDARYHLCVVAPGTWPTSFTNPILIDRDGDGRWTPPGL